MSLESLVVGAKVKISVEVEINAIGLVTHEMLHKPAEK